MVESTVESLPKAFVDLTEKTPIHVLHVDDEIVFLNSAKQCLEMQGAFEVETVSSVEKAMEMMKEKTFDIVVSDYVMPEKSGLEFLKELKTLDSILYNEPFCLYLPSNHIGFVPDTILSVLHASFCKIYNFLRDFIPYIVL